MWAYENLFPELLVWLLVAVCSVWAMVEVYETFFRFRTRTRATRAVVHALLGQSELYLHVPPNIAHVATGRGMRIQRAHLDHDFNNLDAAHMTELHPSTATPSVAEEEMKSMPLYNCPDNSLASSSSSAPEASSSLASKEFHINGIEPWVKKHGLCALSKL